MLVHSKVDLSSVNGPGLPGHFPAKEYLAGVFDGEGCITMRKRSARNHSSYRVTVKVQMASRSIVEAYQERYKGTVHPVKKRVGRKQLHEWSLGKIEDCLEFLLDIQELLIEKRSQAEAAIPWLRSRSTAKRKRYLGPEAASSEALRLQLRQSKQEKCNVSS